MRAFLFFNFSKGSCALSSPRVTPDFVSHFGDNFFQNRPKITKPGLFESAFNCLSVYVIFIFLGQEELYIYFVFLRFFSFLRLSKNRNKLKKDAKTRFDEFLKELIVFSGFSLPRKVVF